MDDNAGARSRYERALRIREKVFGPEHTDVATSLNNLANLLQKTGEFAASKPLYQRALRIWEKALGPEHPDVVTSLENLAALEFTLGASDAGWALLARASQIARKHRGGFYAGSVSEATKLAFSKNNGSQRDIYLTAAVERARSHTDVGDLVLELVLDRKGLLLEAAMPAPGRKEPPAIQTLRGKLRDASTRLSRAYTAADRKRGSAPEVVAELERQKEELEAELSKKSADFRTELTAARLDRAALCAALGSGRIAVEYVRYDHAKFGKKITWEPRLLALVTDTKTCTLEILELGPWLAVAENLAVLRKSIVTGRSRGAAPLADEGGARDGDAQLNSAKYLYTHLITPWLGRLAAGAQVVLIPDDDLAFAPFSALVGPDGKYLIETLAFSLLDSGREVVRLRGRPAVRAGAVVVGGPDFDLEAAKPTSAARPTSRSGQVRAGTGKVEWSPLPGAAAEAAMLDALLRSADLVPKLLLGAAATEGQWKALAPGRRYLHLATHGYFARDSADDTPSAALRNPLLRSGLVFAGANHPAPGGEDSEDGWLTAEEVAGMDLAGTELVVLSACETGLGGGGSGEGVFGLRRAFFQAGARGLVMSLWNVDDEATVQFMQKFWTRLLQCDKTAGCTKSRLLAETQKEMLHDARWHDPMYWAAFVYVGEWER